MSLEDWTAKYVVGTPEATMTDKDALLAYLLQLQGIVDLVGLQYENAGRQPLVEAWFRHGTIPRIIDRDLNTFKFNAETNPLCIRHPDCANTRDCPLVLTHPRMDTCFEPLVPGGLDTGEATKRAVADDGFPSPRQYLVKGDPLPMMIRIRRALKAMTGTASTIEEELESVDPRTSN